VPTDLSLKRPTCDEDSATDSSLVCPLGCDPSTCTGTATTRYTLSASCPGSSTSDDCTYSGQQMSFRFR